MNIRTTARRAWAAMMAAVLLASLPSLSFGAAASNTAGELGCQGTLVKGVSKQLATVTKAMQACTNGVLAGTVTGPCPDATAQAAITAATAGLTKGVSKKCQSACSISGVSCIDSTTCPPNGVLLENCTAGGKNFFESSNMGFPGPFCGSILGGKMLDPEDFGSCLGGVGVLLANELMSNVYGSLASPPSAPGAACIAAILKAAPKAAGKMAGAVSKCRNTQLGSATPAILPNACATGDAKVAATISSVRAKFAATVTAACPDSAVSTLDLCGKGIGGVTTSAAAATCLSDMLEQVAHSVASPDDREYAGISIINAAYPSTASARCGDNVVNQLPSQFMPNGEECDGSDDSACPGECLPPGDTFQCTCGNVRRARTFADGFTADLDNGWAGPSHNSKVTDGAGFVSTVSDCNCDQFDPVKKASCLAGHSTDPVCTVAAEVAPRCSQRIGDGTTCDQVGNNNGAHTDADCRACDAYAANAGDYCTGSARYCIGGTNTGERCNTADDCPGSSCTGTGVCLDGPFAGNGCTGPQQCGVCSGGSNNGGTCATNANCPGGTCTAHTCANKSCIGGANEGNPCTADGQCTGGRCAETSDCSSLCYDADGTSHNACAKQSDCADGQRCRGVCDDSNYCLKMRNGAPLPLSSEGTSVCIDSQFFTNVTGTRNLITGEHEVSYELRSVTILSNEVNSRPCPVCGGWCAANDPPRGTDYTRCEGSCSGGTELACRVGPNKGEACTSNTDCGGYQCTNLACRFDSDCPSGTCSGAASPECGGYDCRIDLSCGGGPNNGKPCRIEAASAFGTVSADCPPDPATNVSGSGLAIKWQPLTSGAVVLKSPAPCDAQGYENYDCNCVTGGGATRNQPNKCAPACNNPDPQYYGRTCAAFTTCEGGAEDGAACDEDSDCSGGGTCSGNPEVCGDGSTGSCSVARCSGGSNDGNVCAQAGQCPGGSCVAASCVMGGAPCADGTCQPAECSSDSDCDGGATCGDVCPSGRCTPLCVARGRCNGGSKDGLWCALDGDCLGGGTCEPEDEEEGACAQGDFNHCNGPGWEFISCAPLQVGTMEGCEMGTDNVLGNANDNIGAGYCVADITQCFLNNGAAEGGSTVNGKADATNTLSVAAYCIPASTNSAVNTTAGLPGPGRIRQRAQVVPNFTQLP